MNDSLVLPEGGELPKVVPPKRFDTVISVRFTADDTDMLFAAMKASGAKTVSEFVRDSVMRHPDYGTPICRVCANRGWYRWQVPGDGSWKTDDDGMWKCSACGSVAEEDQISRLEVHHAAE